MEPNSLLIIQESDTRQITGRPRRRTLLQGHPDAALALRVVQIDRGALGVPIGDSKDDARRVSLEDAHRPSAIIRLLHNHSVASVSADEAEGFRSDPGCLGIRCSWAQGRG